MDGASSDDSLPQKKYLPSSSLGPGHGARFPLKALDVTSQLQSGML